MASKKDIPNLGWNFDHSYVRLLERLYSRVDSTPVANPKLVIFNASLANSLGLTVADYTDEDLAPLFSGNVLPEDAEPIAQAYAGHQFGHFTILGDGRAHLIGEHVTAAGKRFDIQFKGSGQTPYSRRGDGRAALGPMLREYIISEAMHALNIPTTRSLAVITTGEPVIRDMVLQGAILTRVAASHIRVGTFQYLAVQEDGDGLKQLADYTIARHYPELQGSKQPYLGLIEVVMERQIELIVNWLRVGFIHGVMNTDNMAISGETIDYGPCAFMDSYDPNTVFSSIDHAGRYAFANQPHSAQWNLTRFAESLLLLLHEDPKQAIGLAENTVQSFGALFKQEWLAMMRRKLGMFGEETEDEQLIGDLLLWMEHNHVDYTNTFRAFISETPPEGGPFHTKEFQEWWQRWQTRLAKNVKPLKSSHCLMRANNPAIIPRNHKVEEALSMAEEHSDFSKLHALLMVLAKPYDDDPKFSDFCTPPKPEERVYQTFCGT